MRRQHRDQHLHHRRGRIELPTALAFRSGELTEKVFIHLAENILSAIAGLKADSADQIDQFRQLGWFQRGAGKAFIQHSF